jgi:hypothetical protein
MKEKVDCQKYEECSAPICPLEKNSVDNGIWYADEEICQVRKCQRLPLIMKQKLVAKAGASNDKYFTAEMLLSKKQIRKGIEGIDPDQPLDRADAEEKKWMGIKGKRVVAAKKKKSQRVVAKKKVNLKKTGKKRGRKRGRPRKSETGDRK